MPAARTSSSVQGIGASSAQSSLTRREAVDVALERAAIPAGEPLSREPHQLVRHHVGDDQRRGHALAGRELDARRPAARGHDPLDRRAGADLAPEAAEVAHEGVGQAPGAAARAGPADGVAEQVEIGAGDRAARLQDRRVAVHGGAVQPCARAPGLEQPPTRGRPPRSAAAARTAGPGRGRRRRAGAAARARVESPTASWRGRRRTRRGREPRTLPTDRRRRGTGRSGSPPWRRGPGTARRRPRRAADTPRRRRDAPTRARGRANGIRPNTGDAAPAG